jgi:hypothetical protein
MQHDNMGKQRPKKDPEREEKTMFRPPIHRIAANAIKKDSPIRKELFNIVVPTVAAQMKPNLVGNFVKNVGHKYAEAFSVLILARYGMVGRSSIF